MDDDEIPDLMIVHRLLKNQQDEYKRLNRTINRLIRKQKKNILKKTYNEAKRLHKLYKSLNLHEELKEITGASRKGALSSLRNVSGRPILDTEELKKACRIKWRLKLMTTV